MIEKLEKFYPDRSLAIITPFRDSVKELQKRFCTSDLELDITIETIDRIQGMTVDYSIHSWKESGFRTRRSTF